MVKLSVQLNIRYVSYSPSLVIDHGLRRGACADNWYEALQREYHDMSTCVRGYQSHLTAKTVVETKASPKDIIYSMFVIAM